MLIDKKLEDYNELGFCLTVIRDNCLCDNTYKYLDLLIKNMYDMLIDKKQDKPNLKEK